MSLREWWDTVISGFIDLPVEQSYAPIGNPDSDGPDGEADNYEAVLRILQEFDGSWTITDDQRPGFVVCGETMQAALEEVPAVMAMWDEEAAHDRWDR